MYKCDINYIYTLHIHIIDIDMYDMMYK